MIERTNAQEDPDMTEQTVNLETMTVRRWGEEEDTPIVLDPRRACGLFSDHVRRGCITLTWSDGRGRSGIWHLTTADALRLSDLLRAMADAGEWS